MLTACDTNYLCSIKILIKATDDSLTYTMFWLWACNSVNVGWLPRSAAPTPSGSAKDGGICILVTSYKCCIVIPSNMSNYNRCRLSKNVNWFKMIIRCFSSFPVWSVLTVLRRTKMYFIIFVLSRKKLNSQENVCIVYIAL